MSEQQGMRERLRVHASVAGPGQAHVSTGLPVLDHLLTLMSEHGALDLALEVAPGDPRAEVVAAAEALGEALGSRLRAEGVRGHGSAVVPADEALAHVALEASGRPLVVANVDLSDARVGGLGTDLVSDFLHVLATSAGLTLHVRLIDGDDPQHVLEAIFKALGVALAQAARPRVRREEQ
jgi:imidazoleglycerol-phosphate dehydratase